MGTHQDKAELARLVVAFLDHGRVYSRATLERTITALVKSEVLQMPGFAADHVRMAMLEAGILLRDEADREYRVAPGFEFPEEREARLVQQVASRWRNFSDTLPRDLDGLSPELKDDVRMVKCPSCDARMLPSRFRGHFLKRHREASAWARKMDKWFRT